MVTTQDLLNEGYTILNGKIVDYVLALDPENVGDTVFSLRLQGDQWQCNFGNFIVDSKKLAGILQTIDVQNLADCVGTNVRIAIKSVEYPVAHLGNIIFDVWYVEQDALPRITDELILDDDIDDEDLKLEVIANDENDEDDEA